MSGCKWLGFLCIEYIFSVNVLNIFLVLWILENVVLSRISYVSYLSYVIVLEDWIGFLEF